MSLKNEHNKTNAIIQNNFRAPIASLDCMDEIGYSTDGSMTTNPPSRQISVTSPSGIKYRNLGKSGLRVSNLALGTWVAFGTQMSEELAEEVVTAAYENGINIFDTADVYGSGRAESLLGKILKRKGWRRSSYVVTTKLFWTIKIDSERSLSRKNIIEGLQASLERLQLSYVDVVFANKADPMVPMEEVVRAFTYCINQGMAMYWGTSKWSSMEIMEAYSVARACNLIPPLVEQAEYHMFQRDKVELYMPELFYKIGVGTITWCPQMFGIAGGKYDEGIQLLSRGSVRKWLLC